MKAFNAMLYGAALPAAGVRVDVVLTEHVLQVGQMDLRVETGRLVVSVGGFEHDELFLNWRDADGQSWAIKPLTADDIALLLQTAPSALQAQLQKWHQRNRHIKTVWGTIGGLAAACVLALLLLWWQYDHAVGWVADRIPLSTEQQLGESALEQLKAEGNIIDSGVAVNTVRDIGGKLTKGSRYKYQWYVKNDKTVNAFAMPGGIVVVHSGLLAKTVSADELAGVLAHEVQHVEQRHSLKNMINSLGWAAVLTVVLGDVSAMTAVIAHQVGAMYFSRDLEDEADRLGYAALVRARIAPDGMVSFFQKLADEHKGKEAPGWISSHPETSERVKTIQGLIKSQPCPDCKALAFDWRPVQASLEQNKKKS